jgi:PAS domain S-box-containing protein
MKIIKINSEEKLIESEKRFRDIALCSADWIWEVNNKGKYTFASGNIKKILGYSPEEIIGKTPFDFMSKEEAEIVGKKFMKFLSEKKPIVDLENWNISKDGRKVLLLTNGVPVLDDNNNLMGYRGVDKEITEQKNAQEIIKKSEKKYKAIFENSIDAIINIDLKTKMTDISPAFEAISGYNPKEYVGTSCLKIPFLTKRSIALISKNITELTIKKIIEPFSISFTSKDGLEKYAQISASIILKDNNLVGFQALIRDITKQKIAENKLKERVEELERFHKITVGREMKMIELKKEIEKCKKELEQII